MGRVDYNLGRVSGHNGPITDIKWNPFNDNVIASSSDDCTVKLWHIPDGGLKTPLVEWLFELVGHCRKVAYVEWHPTAENVLASVGFDHRILIWNIASGSCLVNIDCHEDTVYSISFNRNGSLLATTCKDKILRIINARTGELLQVGWCHDGNKAAKVAYIGDKGKLVTTGFSRSSTRQLAIWDENDLSRPVVSLEIDASSGVLFPFYDMDTHMLYIAGKGDGNIRFYEVTDNRPFIHYLSEFRSTAPQRGLGIMPKRGLKVSQCEIFRFYKVHNTQNLVEPVSFIVPRKSETFQADLFPSTPGPTPALTADEWICGIDRDPVLISLKAGFVTATNKPVQVRKMITEDGDERPQLITADRNNERKFRFLSEVTKADYREIELREDRERIQREEQIRNRMNEILSQKRDACSPRHEFSASPPNSPRFNSISEQAQNKSAPVTRLSLSSGDELPADDEDEESGREPNSGGSGIGARISPAKKSPMRLAGVVSRVPKSPATTSGSSGGDAGASDRRSRDSFLQNSTDSDGYGLDQYREDEASLPSVRCAADIVSAPVSPKSLPSNRSTNSVVISPLCNRNSSQPILPMSRRQGKQPTSIVPPLIHSSTPLHHTTSAHVPLVATTSQVLPRVGRPFAMRLSSSDDCKSDEGRRVCSAPATRPGRILPGPPIPKEQTAHIKPFLISHSQPPTPRGGKIVSDEKFSESSSLPDSPSKKEFELQRLYTQQCKEVRKLLDSGEQKDKRILQLQSDVKMLSNQLGQLERQFAEKREEVDSLRFEICWKDNRIEELQTMLYQTTDSKGSKAYNSRRSSDESSV